MRVMFLASGDLWAGAEAVVYQLACGLKEIENVEISVVLLNSGRLSEELKKVGVEIYIVDEALLPTFCIVREIFKIVEKFSPHIIHSHRYKENLIAWFVSKVVKNVLLVATQHGMPELIDEKQRFKDRVKSALSFYLLSFGFRKTIAVSQEMQTLLIAYFGFSEKKLEVIPNGIPLPSEVKKKKEGKLCIGSAGRLFPIKGYDFFIEVAAKVVSMNKQVQFFVAGDGPEHKRLERTIRKYELQDQFTLIGHVDDMVSFYKDLDVYVNTSVHEGIPMSVLEAMGHNLPVIVPNVGGFPEIVEDGESGYLVAERDADLFAQKILGLVDSERRKKMGNSARKRVEKNFSRNVMTEKYYQLYGKLLSGG